MSDKKKEIFAPYVSVEGDLPKYGAEIVFRDEQEDAIDRAYKHLSKSAGKEKVREFLWNAKMRFGKTICALELARKLGARTTLIVTHRPVVDEGWHTDFKKVFNPDRLKTLKDDFLASDQKYEYGSRSLEKEEGLNFPKLTAFAAKENCHGVYFVSMQYLALAEVVGGKNAEKQKRDILEFPWDMVIVDEAHEGTQTERGQNVLKMLRKEGENGKEGTKMLHLSGTPFNLYDNFKDDEVYNWDYVKEQTAKENWDPARGPNPYLTLPRMNIFTYDLGNLVVGKDVVFSFAEFFRTKSGTDCPAEEQGKFVHEDWVRKFLDKLCEESATSNYPFSTDAYRLAFNHTLWVVPGVKEAKALERLLKEHDVFSNFEVVNVAGDNDEDEARTNALDGLRKKITGHGRDTYTITLSCGRLTTGVTVKEWTAVFYLKGSENTSAATYMQTIFRTQSPYVFEDKEDGVRKYKANCYVFDFAPDRSLRMLAETAKFSTLTQKQKLNAKNVGSHDEDIQKMRDFLKFCPVISLDGTMQEFDAERLFTKLNEVYIDRVVYKGFADNSLYDVQALLELDAGKLNELGEIISKTTSQKKLPKAGPLPSGLQLSKGGLTPNGKSPEPSPDDPEDLDEPNEDEDDEEKKLKEARRKERDNRIKIISGLAVRVPLMMFGAEVTSDSEEITRENFTEKIDDKSWEEFMPRGVTKADFNKIRTAFNQTIFTGAGKRIRQLAREADDMTVTDRIQRIAEIFGTFQNPDKETVLTPWRVVNMHMSDTIGGYCFFDEAFSRPDDKLFEPSVAAEPRFVDRKGVTDQVFFDRAEGSFDLRSKILEINSKTGLYPLYVAYTLFRARKADFEKLDLIEDASKYSVEEEHAIWDDILLDNIYVVCNTEMAARITKRTLVGFRDVGDDRVNIKPLKLVEEATGNREKLIKELKRPGFWHEGAKGEDMKFNAVVGNPPYQVMTAKTDLEKNGQARRKSIFHLFQMVADSLNPNFASLIYPGGRWIHRSGKGMEEFGLAQINDPKLAKVIFYPNSEEIFESVAIADGISIVLKDGKKTKSGFDYVYHEGGKVQEVKLEAPGDKLIALNPRNESIVCKVEKFVAERGLQYVFNRVLSQKLFGIESEFVELNPKKVKPLAEGYKLGANEIKLYTNDKAGKAGRSQWYVANRSVIAKDKQCYIDQWKVVVSSANAGGQKRDSQLAIIDNHSAFGRSRVALGSFKTKTEAENFYRFCCTALVRFMFLMTDEALTSLGKKVPDLMDYTAKNKLVDFSQDLDGQLNKLVGLTADEVSYIKGMIRPLAS